MARHTSYTMSVWLRDLRMNRDMLRGALSAAPTDGFYRLLDAGRSVAIEDGEMTGNDHRWRWLVVDGDHIGQRESWQALERLATRCVGLDDNALRALKSAEMDREDRLRGGR